MRTRYRVSGLSVVVLFMVGLACTASTLVVSQDNGDFLLIQEAIDAAADHDHVIVQDGTYCENLRFSKPLSLVAVGDVTLKPSDSDLPAISVTEVEGILIHGLNIIEAAVGFQVVNSTGAISGCSLATSDIGIHAMAFSDTTLTITDLTLQGVDGGVGVQILGVGRTMLFGCSFSDLGTGVVIGGRATAVVARCNLTRNFGGISVASAASLTLLDSEIRDNGGSGVLLSESPAGEPQGMLALIGNRIENNGSWGITLCGTGGTATDVEAFNLFAVGNTLVGNGRGATCPEDLLDNL